MTLTRRFASISIGLSLIALLAAGRILLGVPTAHAAGTIFSDDFESDAIGSPAAGWNVVSGTWAVALDGTHVLKQSDTNTATAKSIDTGSVAAWTDYSVVAQVKPGSASAGTSNVVAARYRDANNAYSLILKDGNSWYFGKKVNGSWTTFANGGLSYNTSTWYTFEIDASGSKLTAFLNGTRLASATDSTFSSGGIAVMSRTTIEVDNVAVTAMAPPPPPPSPSPSPSPSPTPTPIPPPPSPTPSPSPPSNVPSTIQGTVTVSGGGAPIAGASVTTQPATTSATTDSSGAYTLGVSAGTFNVIFSARGFNTDFARAVSAPPNGVVVASKALIAVPSGAAEDLFSRPDQSGIGTASDGHTWANDFNVYPTGSVSITNGEAYVQTVSANTDLDQWMGIPYRDEEITADLYVVNALSDPNYLHGGRLLARVQGSDSWIVMAINTQNDTLTIWVDNSGNWTQIGSASQAFSPTTWYHAKIDVIGSKVYGKAWPLGSAEPGWMVTATQTQITTPGVGGLRCGAADVLFANYLETPITQISGTVTDAATGSSVAGATVTLSNTGVSTATDASGNYVFGGLAAGTYTVIVSATGHASNSTTATVSTGQSASGVNLALS